MIINCPNCAQQLEIPKRILDNARGLAPEKTMSIKCPKCNDPITLSAEIISPSAGKKGKGRQEEAPPLSVTPPPPPDISWLKDGRYEGKSAIEDVPLALILVREGPIREQVTGTLEGLGYKAELVTSVTDAIEKIQFVDYACIVLHSQYDANGINSSEFHKKIRAMSMSKRRFIFYVLIGKEFRTFYNLQALAYSANLVVNEEEIPVFSTILRKAIPEYEELFGPIMEELRYHGR
jgi:CheY-like chemotaxis protein